jgi:hypothetical protein
MSVDVTPVAPSSRSWRRYWPVLLILGLALLVVLSGLSYTYGHSRGLAIQDKTLRELEILRERSGDYERRLADLQQQLVNSQQGALIDQQAAEQVRQEVVASEEKIAALKADLVFYRGLMAPTATEKGLSIRSIALHSTGEPGAFRYELVLQQLAVKHALLKGQYQITLRGELEGKEEALTLKDVSAGAESPSFRFRYFEKLQGTLQLPAGFAPGWIEVVAETREKRPIRVQKQFSWSVSGK